MMVMTMIPRFHLPKYLGKINTYLIGMMVMTMILRLHLPIYLGKINTHVVIIRCTSNSGWTNNSISQKLISHQFVRIRVDNEQHLWMSIGPSWHTARSVLINL